MFKKGNTIPYFVFGMFMVVGLLFFMLGIYIMISQNISKENRVYTTAIIERIDRHTDSDGDTHYDVFISYDVDGKIYQRELNSYMSGYYEGKKIEVYYDKNNPSTVKTESSIIGMLIFAGLGLVIFVIGFIGLLRGFIKKRKNKILKITGKPIYATYVSIQLNTSYSVNGINPYNIICEWDDPNTNKKYLFKSENLWFNPEQYILQNNITTFTVFINPNNIKEYIVDISSIKNNVVDLT